MASLTPIERLEWLQTSNCLKSDDLKHKFYTSIDSALDEYSNFLKLVHQQKYEVLLAYKRDAEDWKKRSYNFGQYIAEALEIIAGSQDKLAGLYRMIVI